MLKNWFISLILSWLSYLKFNPKPENLEEKLTFDSRYLTCFIYSLQCFNFFTLFECGQMDSPPLAHIGSENDEKKTLDKRWFYTYVILHNKSWIKLTLFPNILQSEYFFFFWVRPLSGDNDLNESFVLLFVIANFTCPDGPRLCSHRNNPKSSIFA